MAVPGRASGDRTVAVRSGDLRRPDPRSAAGARSLIPDYGGGNETFTVATIDPPYHLGLRMTPVRHVRLAPTGGDFLDWLTVAGMAAGLCERAEPTQH